MISLKIHTVNSVARKHAIPTPTVVNWIKGNKIPAPDVVVTSPEGHILLSGWTTLELVEPLILAKLADPQVQIYRMAALGKASKQPPAATLESNDLRVEAPIPLPPGLLIPATGRTPQRIPLNRTAGLPSQSSTLFPDIVVEYDSNPFD